MGRGWASASRRGYQAPSAAARPRLVIATPVLQVTASVIIALFLIQVARRLAAQSSNPIAVGLYDGLSFLTS